MEYPIRFSDELRTFVDENIEHIRMRSSGVRTLARELSLPNPNSLREIEELYKGESVNEFRLSLDASWADIKEAYMKKLLKIMDSMPQQTRSQIDEKKREIKAELRRFMIAKFLQLNKFIATPEEVRQELARILNEIEG